MWQSEPVILPTARRHGVADPDMLHALRNSMWFFELDDGMTMFIGPDRAGRPLEIGVVDGPAIAHAMPARDKFLPRR